MNTTTNHGLNKPEYTDPADIADLNVNFDKIDVMPILYSQSTEPTNKVANKTIWYDTTNSLLKLWNGSSWSVLAASSDHDHSYADIDDLEFTAEWVPDTIEPTSKVPLHTWWYDISSNEVKYYNASSAWVHAWYAKTYLAEDSDPSLSADLDANDYLIYTPVLKDYSETVKAHGTTGGSITLDLEDGNHHTITLNAATTFTFSHSPSSGKAGSLTILLNQGSTAYSVTWPSSVDWAAGEAPDLSGTSTEYLLTFLTYDGGTTWYGLLAGSDFS